MTLRVGLITNPVAGIGGEAGLGGSDGSEIQALARAMGGKPRSAVRASRVIEQILERGVIPEFLTGGGPLGEDLLRELQIGPAVVHRPDSGSVTAAQDTIALAHELRDANVDIILFAGGDGTARDVSEAVDTEVLCLGIPSGVKMHSAVFAVTPDDVAAVVAALDAGRLRATLVDVVDIDEEARRQGDLQVQLFGQMLVPETPSIQRGKRSPGIEGMDYKGIAATLLERAAGAPIVLGPGTTLQSLGSALGVELSLLGVDVFQGAKLVARNVSATELIDLVSCQRFLVVVSPIGGQGIILGRGNQQINGAVLDRLAPGDLVVVCGPRKLAEFAGRALAIDAPTMALNQKFSGPVRVMTGPNDTAITTVRAGF